MYMAVIFNDSILAKHVSDVLNADLTLIKHSIPALNSLLVLILVTLAFVSNIQVWATYLHIWVTIATWHRCR